MVNKSADKATSDHVTSGPSTSGPSTESILPVRKFKSPRISQLRMDNISVLIGKDNYQSWSDQMSMIFTAVGRYDVIVDGAKPALEGANDDLEAFNEITSAAIVLLIQVIAKPILTIIGRITHPHEIWNHLRTQYYSDTAFSFIHELNNLFTIGSTYDSTKPITEFIENFESKWAIITQLSDRSNNLNLYRKKFNEFLRCDEAKRDILLSALVPYMENVIDHISTKTDITFAEAKSRLISRPSQSSQDAALLVTSTNTKGKGKGKKSWKKRFQNKSNSNNNPNDSAMPL